MVRQRSGHQDWTAKKLVATAFLRSKGESIMQEAAVPLLTTWGSFYVIIGSAAAALTGLMFVVITLIAGAQVRRSSGTVGAFGTPTVVHFCAALLVATILSAPWQ